MYIPEPYFENVPEIGDLYIDYIFLEYEYPILFTCKNDADLFLCLCYDNYKEQKWYLVSISDQVLNDFIHGKISYYNVFKQNNLLGCSIKWSPSVNKESYCLLNALDFEDEDLPNKSVFFDLEDVDEDVETYLQSIKGKYMFKKYYCKENKSSFKNSNFFNYNVNLELIIKILSNQKNIAFKKAV